VKELKVSTRGRYGLRALIDLAVYENSGAISIREISERQQISEQYLEQLFASLRKAGIVKSVRGAHGGYLLNQLPGEITLKDILNVLEGPVAPADCVLADGNCELVGGCVAHDIWIEFTKKINEFLDSITLADLKKMKLRCI
jgi:Rrf2 family protein